MSGEALSMEHTYGGIMYDIIGQMFLPSASGLNMRFSGAYVRDDTGGTDKVEVVVRGRHSEVDPGKAKVGDDTEFKVTSELTYYKLTVNNKVLMEIDILNFVYKVNGVDRLADQRKAMNL